MIKHIESYIRQISFCIPYVLCAAEARSGKHSLQTLVSLPRNLYFKFMCWETKAVSHYVGSSNKLFPAINLDTFGLYK